MSSFVMPFGLTNALSSFYCLMNSIFKQQLRKFGLVFFNDILVYSATWKEHVTPLREVLSILRRYQLYANKGKCNFGTTHIEYLGHIISKGIVSMGSSKVDELL